MFTVTGKGIICREPELRFTQSNVAICHAVAVNNDNYNGNETAHFTELVLFGERAEDFHKEITKSCLIEITSGILKHPVSEYNGKKYYKTEVTVLEWNLIMDYSMKKDKPAKKSYGNKAKK